MVYVQEGLCGLHGVSAPRSCSGRRCEGRERAVNVVRGVGQASVVVVLQEELQAVSISAILGERSRSKPSGSGVQHGHLQQRGSGPSRSSNSAFGACVSGRVAMCRWRAAQHTTCTHLRGPDLHKIFRPRNTSTLRPRKGWCALLSRHCCNQHQDTRDAAPPHHPRHQAIKHLCGNVMDGDQSTNPTFGTVGQDSPLKVSQCRRQGNGQMRGLVGHTTACQGTSRCKYHM